MLQAAAGAPPPTNSPRLPVHRRYAKDRIGKLRSAPGAAAQDDGAERRLSMRHFNPSNAAISVGTVLGAWHLLWVALVATGIAKPVLDFVLRLHFLQFEYTLAPFILSTAAMLVGLTFIIGALVGLLFALVWNWLGRRPEAAERGPALSVR
jgi:hypothetical protein